MIYGYTDLLSDDRERILPITTDINISEMVGGAPEFVWNILPEGTRPRFRVFEIETPRWMSAADFFADWHTAYRWLVNLGASPRWSEDVWRALMLIPRSGQDLTNTLTTIYLLRANLRSPRKIEARDWFLQWAASKPTSFVRPFLPPLTASPISETHKGLSSTIYRDSKEAQNAIRQLSGEINLLDLVTLNQIALDVVPVFHSRHADDRAALENLVF